MLLADARQREGAGVGGRTCVTRVGGNGCLSPASGWSRPGMSCFPCCSHPALRHPPPLSRRICRYLTPARRAHIESLELLDEVEEWHLLLEHYALVWGARDPRATGDGGGNDSVDGGDGNDADDPSVCDSAPGQRASPFVAAFMLRPVPRQATAPGRAAPPPPLGRPAAAPPRGGRLRQPRGGCDDLFPGAHLAGAE